MAHKQYIFYFGYCQCYFGYILFYFELEGIMEIGARLSTVRSKVLSMNQKEFSALLGISQGALSEVENGKRGLPMEAIIELMKYSKSDNRFSVYWILTGENEPILTTITTDETEMLENYSKLDNRGKHRIHTVIYEELDRIDAQQTEEKAKKNVG